MNINNPEEYLIETIKFRPKWKRMPRTDPNFLRSQTRYRHVWKEKPQFWRTLSAKFGRVTRPMCVIKYRRNKQCHQGPRPYHTSEWQGRWSQRKENTCICLSHMHFTFTPCPLWGDITMSPKVSSTYSGKSKSKNLISSRVPHLIYKLTKFAMSHVLGITHLGCNSSLWNSETEEPVVCSQNTAMEQHNL